MFLRNGWYTALWSHELTDKPVGKTFLDERSCCSATPAARSARWRIAAAIAPRRCRWAASPANISPAAITG